MSDETVIARDNQGWRGWAAAGFAALWGAVGGFAMPSPERAIMEEAAAYSGKLFGTGMACGLVAAVIAHALLLRGASTRTKVMTYLAGAVVGGLVALTKGG